MSLDLTFKQICEFIEKDDPKLIDAMDKLLGIAIVCSPFVIGPGAVAAVPPMIAVKNETVKIAKGVFDGITGKEDDNYLARQQRMEIAYGLICFTAFFEALDLQMPKELRERINLTQGEMISLAKNAKDKKLCQSGATPINQNTTAPANSFALLAGPFPHPAETLTQQIERNTTLWKQMAENFRDFVQNLALWEEAEEKDQVQILTVLENVPMAAAECFEAQYFELARRYEDFAVWASLQEHKKAKALISSLSEYVRKQTALVKESETSIDIGFAKMHDAVLSIPETMKISQAVEIADGLKRHYDKKVTETIAENDESQGDKPHLRFPRIRDAFIPQSFKVLRWTKEGKSLEDEASWKGLEMREDLGAFLLSYLSSPYSTEAPLVILGHPGSGKSLLTKILSAQLMSKHYTSIRVPLREVDADAAIVTQIEERIHLITGHSTSWARFSSAFKNCPPLVMLDGYDELLQASGKVFSRYLKEVQVFQDNETVQGRPLRVIVTSRITLIDKADIPQGATIIRLLEFNKRQRDRWISIWNQENANYFKESMTDEFALPEEIDDKSTKILSLAEQPLILLMLALYDSEGNQLRKSKLLDRTILYDSLLRQFVEREKMKDQKFKELSESNRTKELDLEMQRLAVAALGMYNRRKLHILSPELNEDIKFFDLARPISNSGARSMTQADLLLGSFFFVHKSKAQVRSGTIEHHEDTAAFEFLHNTFGEFLTAEFIIRQAITEVAISERLKKDEDLRLEKRLSVGDGLSNEWFASLVYTPLFTRPVVLEMMREWIGHELKRKGLSEEKFLIHLDTILMNQIKRLLSKREMPSIIRGETAQEGYRIPFGDHPLLGHIAIYSINLILLRIVIVDKPYDFDESLFVTHEDGARPWDRLTHIWRSWFSLDNLNGVTAIMLADRMDSKITVQAKEKFQVAESQNRLETYLRVAISLGDNISSGIAGLLLFEISKDNQLGIEDIAQRLKSEKLDMEFKIAMKRLFEKESHTNSDNAPEFMEAINQTVEMALRGNKQLELKDIALSLRRVITRLSWGESDRMLPVSERFEFLLRKAIHPKIAAEVAIQNPAAALVILQLAKRMPYLEWVDTFIRNFHYDRVLNPRYMLELSERDPEAAPAWLQLIKELVGQPFLRRMNPESFERAFNPRYLQEMIRRNPEVAPAWLQLMKELGGRRLLRRMDPEFFEQTFDPLYLQEMIRRNPEAALAWVQLMKEFGGKRFQQQMDLEFSKSELDLRYLKEMVMWNPEAVQAWVQLMKEFGGQRFLGKIDPRYFEEALDPRFLLDLNELSPKIALAWVQLMKELGGESLQRMMDPKFFQRVFNWHYLQELTRRNPEATVTWVQLMKEFGGERFLGKMDLAFFQKTFNPRYLQEMFRRNPEAALALVDLAYKVGAERFFELEVEGLIEQWFGNAGLVQILQQKPTSFTVLLRLTRIRKSPRATEMALRYLISILNQPSRGKAYIEMLPLTALGDLQWLAKTTASPEIDSVLNHLDDETAPP